MRLYILTVATLLALDVAASLYYLAIGDDEPTPPTIRALAIAASFALLAWGIWILRGES